MRDRDEKSYFLIADTLSNHTSSLWIHKRGLLGKFKASDLYVSVSTQTFRREETYDVEMLRFMNTNIARTQSLIKIQPTLINPIQEKFFIRPDSNLYIAHQALYRDLYEKVIRHH